MGFFDDRQKENMAGIYFAGIAIFIVLIFGIFAGKSFGAILINLLLSGVIFYGIGFGVVILLKSFVPEIMESDDVGDNVDATIGDDDDDRETVEYSDAESDAETAYEDDADDSPEGLSVKASKDGTKITISSEDGDITEDPETVAKAIRTMMARDED